MARKFGEYDYFAPAEQAILFYIEAISDNCSLAYSTVFCTEGCSVEAMMTPLRDRISALVQQLA